MPETAIPPGYALIRLADLAALLTRAAPGPAAGDPWAGLAAATGLVTANLAGLDAGHLADDVAARHVIRSLVTLAAAGLSGCLGDQAGPALQDIGLIAASRGQGPDGKPL